MRAQSPSAAVSSAPAAPPVGQPRHAVSRYWEEQGGAPDAKRKRAPTPSLHPPMPQGHTQAGWAGQATSHDQQGPPKKLCSGARTRRNFKALVAALQEATQGGWEAPPPANFCRQTDRVSEGAPAQPTFPDPRAGGSVYPPRADVPNPAHPSPGWCYAPLPWRGDPRAADWWRRQAQRRAKTTGKGY